MKTRELRRRFLLALEKLNPQQRRAVETVEGPVMVVAGPGTGKTQVLTSRIAKIIDKGLAQPDGILALTFTRVGAVTMRERLAQLVGAAAYKVNINTFHGFCQEVINNHPTDFIWNEGGVMDELTRVEILQNLINILPLKILRPLGKKYLYLPVIGKKIEELKKENILPERYQRLVEREREKIGQIIAQEQEKKKPSKKVLLEQARKLEKMEELGVIYEAYQQELKQRGLYDYDDMIMAVIEGLENNSELLANCQEQWQYLLVDEYQDTNNAQDKVLNLLASYWGEEANLFVVGDPQQSIYRFQGANLENFLSFTKRFPKAQVINLEIGYRCSNKTYQLAQELIKTTKNRDPRLGGFEALKNAEGKEGEAATLTAAANEDVELVQIITKIKELKRAGVAWEEMAIIYRNNQESERIMQLCASYGVPVEIEGGMDVLKQEAVEALLGLVKLVVGLDSDKGKADDYLYQVLWQEWWEFPQVEILKLRQDCRDRKVRMIDEVVAGRVEEFKKLGEQLLYWHGQSQRRGAGEVLGAIMEESGLLAYWGKRQDGVFILTYLYTLQRAVIGWEKTRARSGGQEKFRLKDLVEVIQTMQEQELKLPAQDLDVVKGAVSLTTVHKAKGRQWREVFIYGLNDGVWSGGRKRLDIDLPMGIVTEVGGKEDEQVRLLYVAATRASERNFISWHLEVTEGTVRTPKAESEFAVLLRELEKNGLTQAGKELAAAEVGKNLGMILEGAKKQRDYDERAREFFKEKIKRMSLSVSMLNTYLADDEVGHPKFVKKYLLQAPDTSESVAAALGNSLHFVLERAGREILEGRRAMTLEEMKRIFEEDLGKRKWEKQDLVAGKKVGEQALEGYYPRLQEVNLVGVERKFGEGKKIGWGKVLIQGKIDRIDLLDKEQGWVRVVDYKTGRVLTENEILGKAGRKKLSVREQSLAEEIQTPYLRQLLFYKMLVEGEVNFPYKVKSGCLEFIKNEKGRGVVSREIILEDGQVELLRELIDQVWEEIVTLKFLEK